jgi:hypothetical protein
MRDPRGRLIDPSDDELAAATDENLFSLFRGMATLPGGLLVERPDLARHLTPPANPMFKGIWRPRLTADDAEAAIDEVEAWLRASGVPFAFWWTGWGTTPADLGDRLVRRGWLSMYEQIRELAPGIISTEIGAPAMVADLHTMDLAHLARVPPEFRIEIVRGEAGIADFVKVFVASYEVAEVFGQAWAEATLALGFTAAPWTLYLGRIGGEPVATTLLHTGGGVAGVYAVGTIPSARGRGLGGAITLRA